MAYMANFLFVFAFFFSFFVLFCFFLFFCFFFWEFQMKNLEETNNNKLLSFRVSSY